MPIATLPAGGRLRASQVNAIITQVNTTQTDVASLQAAEVAYYERTTAGTVTTTTQQPYIRVDNIPIISGQAYLISLGPMIFNSSIMGDLISAFLRGVTAAGTGTLATIASPQFTALIDSAHTAGGSQKTLGMTYRYAATTTGYLSLLVSYVRSLGTGNVNIIGQAGYPVQMSVFRIGTAKASSGTSL